MNRLVTAEFRKLRTTQVWFWLLLACAAVSALLVVGQIAPSDGVHTSADVPDIFTSSANAYVITFVLGVLGVTTEFRYQTITPTFLQTPSRWAVVTAKMITYALTGAVFALVALAVQLAVALPWLSAKGIDTGLGTAHVRQAILGVFVVLTLFGIVGLGVGALLRNQIVAVTVGIVFLLVVEPILTILPGVRAVFPFTPTGAVLAVLTVDGSRDLTDGVTLLPVAGGVVALLLWAFVPAVVGAAVTLDRDIT